MPKVSFIVPIYNKESYIAECLESLTKQTLEDIEVVVVDDKSTDDSLEIVNWYAEKDKRIKVYPLKKNHGRSYARNFGNSKATAKILCVQDADDIALIERAKIVYSYMVKHKAVDIFYSSFYVSDNSGVPAEMIKAIPFDLKTVKETGVTYMGHSTMAYYKTVVDHIKYQCGKWCKLGLDDWRLQIECAKKGYRFGYSELPTMIYRQTANSISAVRNGVEVYKQKGKYLKSL